MSGTAMVPCIICDRPLQNVESDCENQPYKGTAFDSYGHYGSTAFDPMNGSSIEINICDECLTEKGKQGKVLWIRRRKAVMHDGSIWGWFWIRGSHYVDWNPELDETDGLRINDQVELESVNVETLEELLELMKTETVELNSGFTPEDVFWEGE